MIVDIEQNNDSLINTLQCQKYEEDVADNLFSASGLFQTIPTQNWD